VIMACRSMENAEAAAKEIRDATKDLPGAGTVHVVKLDLGSLASVRQCAKELLQNESRINLLVNNAGRALNWRRRTIFTVYKFEVCKSVHHRTIQINHQPDATIFPVYFPDVYLQLNMFRAFSRPSSGAQ